MKIHFAAATACFVLVTVLLLPGNTVAAQRNPERGKDAFVRQCALCHTIDKGDSNRFGPNLFGIMGRKAGTVPGFKYSPAFRSTAAWNWNDAKMGAWISSPQAMIPGSKMDMFQGVATSDRNDIIAWLAEHGGHAS